MNQPQGYMDVNQAHNASQGPPPNLSQYAHYGPPPAMQPAAHGYTPNYPAYPYPNSMAPMAGAHHVTSSMGGQMVPQSLPLPTMATQPPQQSAPPPSAGGNNNAPFDQTGQIAPPGMKPRVTATLWEDEGSLCFQVEANGVCVARREDNHMINGTKLLNVAGMTRGRRDGILKSEKTRHVVKIGPMHLKGVWIPFERALDFANKEKITEMLYPLFVHNIGALLYHPTNQGRQSIGNAAMAARRSDQTQQAPPPTQQGIHPPTLTHYHTMPENGGSSAYAHTAGPHTDAAAGSDKPGLARAHSFSDTPVSASSLTMASAHPGNSYDYGAAQAPAMHGGQLPSIESGMGANSIPTPAGSSPSGVPYHSAGAYDSSRQMYPAQSNFSGYPSQTMQRYGGPMQTGQPSGVKSEMGPPARGGADGEHVGEKQHDGYAPHPDAGAEHENDYAHNRPVPQDSSHVSPEMTHSPHQNGSGRATPRTANPYQTYGTPQRGNAQLPSSNLSYVMSHETRGGAPASGPEPYAPNSYAQQQQQQQQPPPPQQQQPQTPQYPAMNGGPTPVSGTVGSNKRVREVDEEDPYGRPLSAGAGNDGLKRQRTDGGPVGVRPISQPQSVKAGGMRR